jgi:hypothetical protein
MSLIDQYHTEHKARLARITARSVPIPVISTEAPIVRVIPAVRRPRSLINPVPYYPQMWFWELISMPPKPNTGYTPALQKILEAVSKHYSVSIPEMKTGRRTKKPTHARQVVMYLARRFTPMTFPQIGRYLGNKDHTTIIHGVRVIEAKLGISPELQRDIDALAGALR